MPRVYTTKGENALSAKLTIPLTPAMMGRLEAAAAAAQMGKTELARRIVVAALG
jgi:hypothetical protein